MDIADWLRGLGLKQYEPAFRDNAIDGVCRGQHLQTRAARLGVLPIASLAPTPAASPTTTGPVAIPIRTDRVSVEDARRTVWTIASAARMDYVPARLWDCAGIALTSTRLGGRDMGERCVGINRDQAVRSLRDAER